MTYRFLAPLLILLCINSVYGQANPALFETHMLERLGSMIPIQTIELTPLYEDIYTAPHPTKPEATRLKLKVSEGMYKHIGFHFFGQEGDKTLGDIGYFLERQILYYYLMDPEQLPQYIEQHKIQLFLNQEAFGSIGFTSLDKIVTVLSDLNAYELNTRGSQFSFQGSDTTGNTVHILFPAQAWLVRGLEKDELDRELLSTILKEPSPPKKQPITFNEATLTPYKDDLMIYRVPPLEANIAGDIVVRKQEHRWVPVRDENYLNESVANLMLSPTKDSKIKMQLRYYGYGSIERPLDIAYQHLWQHLSTDYNPYVTFTKQTTDSLYLSVIWSHKIYLHLHLLSLTWPFREYRLGNSIVLKGDMYPYIRRDNINELFSDQKD